jgi:hypothetical protein
MLLNFQVHCMHSYSEFHCFFRLFTLAPRGASSTWHNHSSGESPRIPSLFLGLVHWVYWPHNSSLILVSTPLRVPPHPRVPIVSSTPYPDSAPLNNLVSSSSRGPGGLGTSIKILLAVSALIWPTAYFPGRQSPSGRSLVELIDQFGDVARAPGAWYVLISPFFALFGD